ncbi:hypothetical protein ACFL59_12085 [Planctomycetota bacterium]
MSPGRIDEGLALEGAGLHVEILRITDERTYKIMSGMAPLLRMVGGSMKKSADKPPSLYRSKPFVIVTRAEPEAGQVESILRRILPPDKPARTSSRP